MNRSLAIVLLSATALAGFAAAQAKDAKPVAKAAAPAAPAAAPASKPAYGTFGFDEAGMDRSVKPGDSFYDYASGTWAKTTPIPADKSNYGAFNILSDLSESRTRGILDEQAKMSSSKIGIAYATYLDRAAIDAKGLAPIKPLIAKIKATSKAGYSALLGEMATIGVRSPIGGGVGQDDKNPNAYIFSVYQAGLGLPDRDYYLSKDAKLAEAKAAYQVHIAKMLTLAGEPDADARAKAIVDFETAIANVSWTRIDSRDATKTYNKMTVAQLRKLAPGVDFDAMFKAGGAANVTDLVVAQPSAVAAIAKLVADAPIGVLRDQLIVNALGNFSDVLPKALDDENFAFFGTILGGTPQQEERWKRAVQFTSGAMDDEVSKLYVAKYFPPETKAAADQLVKNIISAMDSRIDKLEWMAPETKVKAHAKLAAFVPKIGYPDRWKDYSGLQIVAGDAFGNNLRANKWQIAYQVAKLGKPVERWEWGMTPMTVNAYANFGMVEIVFPAAILQPPFFDPAADPAVNYGGIGAVIGHELSHHFDDQGAKYDASGTLSDWWTPADVKNFTALTGKVVAQYDAYEPLPGMHVKGALTLGENMADLAGLTVAYDAYKKSLNGAAAPVIDGFSGDQRFYLGWAQVWRRSYREATLRQRLLTDPHSPSEQRASIVRNMDPWYGAFQPKPGEKLYLAPADRLKVW
ncbi:peptidase M13 [Sphingomonas sp. Leaf357]|uniref:M13 family metallopeptidase n=1 Tax=Sphingomonas sp. Leaf357 TaxID=1736350 RepID=UPI0006FBF262|nr:M13-type metalloendopeptidase [Sphingomonas sp. Leaf357]KQS04818.1 peptidase M13 [Sphingomonas sp. Leaf357]